jgi:hypothetical protein
MLHCILLIAEQIRICENRFLGLSENCLVHGVRWLPSS